MTVGHQPSDPLPFDFEEKSLLISKAFSPAAPITNRDLFAGRTSQMEKLFDVANQAGQHAIIYGERGVGKTSLAKVVAAMLLNPSDCYTTVYTCSGGDSFDSIWRRVIGDVSITMRTPAFGFTGAAEDTAVSALTLLPQETLTPDDVRRALTVLTPQVQMVLFIDEFDRLSASNSPTLFADTIKGLSDQLVNATLIPVGVADSLDELIAEHASIQRALVQIEMPRMDDEELVQIIERGLEAAEMEADADVVDEIAHLSQGLPHYTHLLAQNACRAAIEQVREVVHAEDLQQAISRALDATSQTIRSMYHRATHSNRETLYAQVLLACAIAPKDDLNTFSASDVRDPFREVMGSLQYDIPSFQSHLNDFSAPLGSGRRGGILERRGEPRSFRYRFTDPLLPPYVLMRGRHDGLISVSP